jgi:hypothetical protein
MFNVSNIRAWAGLVMFNIELHKTCFVRAVCGCCGCVFRLVFSVVLGMTLNYPSVTILSAQSSLRLKAVPILSCVNLFDLPSLRLKADPILTHAVKSCMYQTSSVLLCQTSSVLLYQTSSVLLYQTSSVL